MEKIKVVFIVGPTATGKTGLALELAGLFNGEIVNADSMQVYKYMDVGSAKPGPEERSIVPHHLIDVVPPDEDYTAARFRKEAGVKIADISRRGKTPFVAGGTGLYVKALKKGLFEGPACDKAIRARLMSEAKEGGAEALFDRLKRIDPASAGSIHPNNVVRVVRALEVYEAIGRRISDLQMDHGFKESPFDSLSIGLIKERDVLYRDIEKRVDAMMEEGLLEEVRSLMSRGYAEDLKPMRGLGYKEMAAYIRGSLTLPEAVDLLKKNTRHYAKRQITWFKKDPEIRWFSPGHKSDIIELIKGQLK